MGWASVPASRIVLTEIDDAYARTGVEVDGFVSEHRGFLPRTDPPAAFEPPHHGWDEILIRLPELYRSRAVARELDRLEVLDAGPESLDDALLWRAATVLGVFAHAYARSEVVPPGPPPEGVTRPWAQVCRRLGRAQPYLGYTELIVTNWRVVDAGEPEPLNVENLRLLAPTVDNREERVFYLVQVETLARSAAAVGATVRAQEAALGHDREALLHELGVLIDAIEATTDVTLAKISPNALSPTYVDPVVWANTVAPFAVPFEAGQPGPSGTSSPLFHLFDSFLSRSVYRSPLGVEARNLRATMPRSQSQFLDAVAEVSVPDLVAASGDRELAGSMHHLIEAFAGDRGWLGVHRRKVYGYLAIAFKVGRAVTIGGYTDAIEERGWARVDQELERSRSERAVTTPPAGYAVSVLERLPAAATDSIMRVRLDAVQSGLAYQPGDRLALLPDNDPLLVERTLAALRATGDEVVPLTAAWRDAAERRTATPAPTAIELRTLLTWAALRPVERTVAKALLRVTASGRLHRIVEARNEDQWELPDILELLAIHGYDTRRLHMSKLWQPEAIARIVPPAGPRQYSVASAPSTGAAAATVDLAVHALRYSSQPLPVDDVTPAAVHAGVASGFLTERTRPGDGLRVNVVRSPRFRVDPRPPLLLIAAGSGIAPCRSFLQARAPDGAPTWLLYGARARADVPFLDELTALVESGRLAARIVLSGEDLSLRSSERTLVEDPGDRRRLTDELRLPAVATIVREAVDAGAIIRICGQPTFARDVLDELAVILTRHRVRQLVATGRLVEEAFTPFEPGAGEGLPKFDASEVARHNDDEHGRWLTVDGAVYDMTEFRHLHPGGYRIVDESCGTDATMEWQAVQHHDAPEIVAMLGMYRIGSIRRLDFRGEWGIALGESGIVDVPVADAFRSFVRMLHRVVAMQNAIVNDFGHLGADLTAADRHREFSPYHLALAANTHRRFLGSHLETATGRHMEDLWRLSVGLWAPAEPAGRLGDAVAVARDRPESKGPDLLADLLDEPGAQEALAYEVRALDVGLLSDVKDALIAAVRVFEHFEHRVLDEGGPAVLEALRRVSTILQSYQDAASACAAGVR